MGFSFSKFTKLLGSTYKNTKPVADAVILGSIGAPSAGVSPVISTSGQAVGKTGLFASANTFFKSELGRTIGTAVLSKALATEQVQVRPAELRYATQSETNDANLEVMRQKAEEAGFNPLTVLRAGGINAYATRKTNIPSYAPALYSTKGPSYIETIAGAAAQSYFNRPTEQQKAASDLKIAQQFADLDYTRALTSQARLAGKQFSQSGSSESQVTDPADLKAVEPISEFSKTETALGPLNVSEKVKPTLFGYKSPFTENSWWLPYEEAGLDEMLGGAIHFGVVSALDGAQEMGQTVAERYYRKKLYGAAVPVTAPLSYGGGSHEWPKNLIDLQ